ncbi:MAG: GNAT family N-acetyltransferase [Gemmataceae bacterium]|nr:GNAT family N-acetyltransferase [Gemmataceae bacterium]
MLYRPCLAADHPACLAIFDSNADRYFGPGDRDAFRAFLDAQPGYFGILCDDDGAVVGCGGFGVRDGGKTAVLTWGMVHRDRHGQGLGRALALARLERIAQLPEVDRIVLNTSNETVGFYRKLGFRVVGVTPDGYGKGLDRYDLERTVED